MKQRSADKRSRTEEPVWCEHCRVRIAPYEEAAIADSRAFHKNCFRKAERKGSREEELLEGSGLDLVVA